MQKVVAKLVIGTVITAIGMFGADNSIGTWKRNLIKSKGTPPVANPIKSLTLVYEAVAGGVKLTATGVRADGATIKSTSTAKYDGKDYPVTGANWDTTSLKQIDANTFTFDNKKTGGKYHVTGRYVISKDGKTMTTTIRASMPRASRLLQRTSMTSSSVMYVGRSRLRYDPTPDAPYGPQEMYR